MNPPKLTTARHLLALAIAILPHLVLWADPNSIRVINLTGPIANFNGSGIKLGQIELDVPDQWAAGLSGQIALTTNLTSQTSGTPGAHATQVAGVMVTTDDISRGVATSAKVYSVEFDGSQSGAVNAAIWLRNIQQVRVMNMSAGWESPSDGSSFVSRGLDHQISENRIIFVQAAGNTGRAGMNTMTDPGGAYNVITVGAVNNALPGNTPFVAAYSSRGKTADGRAKPDIVAPGGSGTVESPQPPPQDNVTMPTSPAGTTQREAGTSFAAPHVSAVAARLVEAAASGAFHGSRINAQDPRVMKAVLLNSATKLSGWTQGGPPMGTATHVTQPLDLNQGAGLLNAAGAYDQYAAGEHAETFHGAPIRTGGPLGLGTAPLKGWDLGSVGVAYDLENIYRFKEEGGGQLTATLNWYRDVGGSALDYADQGLVDLDLALWSSPNADFSNPTLVAWSRSTADNVEHLFLTDLEFTYYQLTVEYYGYWTSTLMPPSESYGLAWSLELVPEPGTGLLAALGIGLVVWWRLPSRPSQLA